MRFRVRSGRAAVVAVGAVLALALCAPCLATNATWTAETPASAGEALQIRGEPRHAFAPGPEVARTAAVAEPGTSGRPVLLGRTIANILYGPPWPTAGASPGCSGDMKSYEAHLRKSAAWAVKMLDATSKGPEGLLDGNTFSFGNFDQCISTKSESLGIYGGYTLVDIDYRPSYQLYPEFYNDDHVNDYEPLDDDQTAWTAIKNNLREDNTRRHKYQWAVCLPDACNHEDVQKIVSNVLIPEIRRYGMVANVTVDPSLHTSRHNIYEYTAGFYIVCTMFVVLAVFVIVATLYDLQFLYYQPKSEHGPLKSIMKPFSLISNMERLLKRTEHKEFSTINGIKTLCIAQDVAGHRAYLELGLPLMNPSFMYWINHNLMNGFFKCYVYLETFFVIGGFLTFCLLTKQLNERKRLNFIPIMIYRWLRIIPVYGTLLLTYIFVLPYMNDGPYWRKFVYREAERCKTNWWTNVLFINNYVHADEMCIIPSWYLSCDFHYFIVGTLLTYAIWKWRNTGLMLLGTLIALSTIVPAYILIKGRHYGVFQTNAETLSDVSKNRFFNEVYITSHMRSVTYLIGLYTGYLYMKFKETGYIIPMRDLKIWIPICMIGSILIYISGGWFSLDDQRYVAYEHALYFTLTRILWAALIGYGLIGHGQTGLGVLISGYFSHPAHHVTGKLVFCIYMFQELIQLQTAGSIRTPIFQKMSLFTWKVAADILIALLYALAVNVMVESPFDRLQKKILKKIIGKDITKPNSEHDTTETVNPTDSSTYRKTNTD